MKKLPLKKKAFLGAEVLSRDQLRKIRGGTGTSCVGVFCAMGEICVETIPGVAMCVPQDHAYKCRDSACNLYISETGQTERGHCAWDLVAAPVCFCKTDNHPRPIAITHESVCIQWLS